MIITATDNQQNLFSIDNFYPEDLLRELGELDLLSIPWSREVWQSEYDRRRLGAHPTLAKFDQYVKQNLQKINEITGINSVECDTGFWLDGPGFTMNRHIDNSNVYATMQIYVLDSITCPGTKFTHADNSLRITFPYQRNRGYLMLNDIEQYHEVAGIVPNNTYRLCSYTWFYPKV